MAAMVSFGRQNEKESSQQQINAVDLNDRARISLRLKWQKAVAEGQMRRKSTAQNCM